jgi:hypothetical protein
MARASHMGGLHRRLSFAPGAADHKANAGGRRRNPLGLRLSLASLADDFPKRRRAVLDDLRDPIVKPIAEALVRWPRAPLKIPRTP